MNTKPSFKMIIPIFVLVAASMACNILHVQDMVHEAFLEKCYDTDRATYARAAAKLGLTVETPNYPEGAFYEVCYIGKDDDENITSARMTDGYGPDENAPAENSGTVSGAEGSTPDENEQNESEQTRSIPAGTYTGKFPGDMGAFDQVTNEINLVVSGNGAVSGSAILNTINEEQHKTSSGGNCTYYYEFSKSFAVSGQVVDAWTKSVEVEVTTYEISDNSSCGGENKRRDETCTCEASAEIKDGILTITCGYSVDCGAYLTAAR